MTGPIRVVVLGATGFVGRAVVDSLVTIGADVVGVAAPRITAAGSDLEGQCRRSIRELRDWSDVLAGADVVVNAAGIPDASSTDEGALMGANALLPGVVALLATERGVGRFVHVSSAVVQGDAEVLDDQPSAGGFSPYARSKVCGEELAARFSDGRAVLYRPPSVHGPDRRVTRQLQRVARSPLRSVAAPGDRPTPQTLVGNVGSAVALLATADDHPPAVVVHPWEGLTTTSLLRTLGGREPRRVPAVLAALVVHLTAMVGRRVPLVAAHSRRLQMVWFGQRQSGSWFTDQQWTPPLGPDAWDQLAAIISNSSSSSAAGLRGC